MNMRLKAVTTRITGIMLMAGTLSVAALLPVSAQAAGVELSISWSDARQIAETHGLTGRQALPPGIAKRVQQGKPLPPGIAKQVVPGPMLLDLPEIAGHEWRVAGDDLILIALGTLAVVEILEEVFE